ncbi:hypothetical protein F8M41_004503 [Gigaspora margarita]|uniref:Uncharacterized protein n=1 Tax=Gigaspora margarita TaxID=4874 RepID=A0A8H4AXL8_GIGMA|nr:hypothetical protein F8M41_004503 [Gigaspora margarita]
MLEETEVMNEEEAEEIFNKLKKTPKRPLVYLENSRKCLESKKMAVGSSRITDFFNKDNSDQDDESSEGSSLNESHQILESEESNLDDERCQDAEIIEYKDVKNIEDTKNELKT